MSKGFSLIETAIVVGIFIILSVAVIAVLDPIEKINRGNDISAIQTSESMVAAIQRHQVSVDSVPWTQTVTAQTLSSPEGKEVLNKLVATGELKESFFSTNAHNLEKIYLSTDQEDYKLCFQPASSAFKLHPSTSFTVEGNFKQGCLLNNDDCYFCFGEFYLSDEMADGSGQGSDQPADGEGESQPEEMSCEDFDSEYPNFPWTCNYSDKWSQYSCTNYCVVDLGCDGYCADGERHLRKRYYATGSNFVSCLNHADETEEHYCVSDSYARCDIKSYASSPSDFVYDCENPRRPNSWVE